MQAVTREGAGPAVAGHRRRRDARGRGRLRERHRHRRRRARRAGSASITSGISNQQILSLPVGQEYRDLIKLIPGVQVTQDTIRGPSAGGSGQDNVYQFDGVNVTLPLFGTLSAEPASHDIAQVTTVKGGARAVDFDRAGGFAIDSVSKSGTSEVHRAGQLPAPDRRHVARRSRAARTSRYEPDRSWFDANIGGPVLTDRLYFYGSYYRPENTREQPREPVRRPAASTRARATKGSAS